jgi:hypothetical protein
VSKRLLPACLLGCIAGLPWHPVRSAEAPDAATLEQAARVFAFQARFNEELRKYCGKQFPDAKRRFDSLVAAWTLANKTELEALRAYVGTLDRKQFDAATDSSLSKSLAGLKNADTDQEYTIVCEGFGQTLMTDRPAGPARFPKASRLLVAYLEAHPLPPAQAFEADFQAACVNEGMAREIDFDALRVQCTCTSERLVALLQPAEIAAANRAVQSGGDVMNLEPVKRIASQLAQCTK